MTKAFGNGWKFRTIQFRYSGPNDWKFDANENPVAPGAKDLAELVRTKLIEQRVTTSIIEQHSYYGWAFDSRFDGQSFYNVLNPGDKCYLTISMNWIVLKSLLFLRPSRHFDNYCAVVETVLKNMPAVSTIAWLDNLPKI